MKSGIGALVKGLESGKDVLLALEELKLGEWKAVRLLHSRSGRRLLAGRRQLGRIGALLLAQRFEPYAVQQLCKLIADGKGDSAQGDHDVADGGGTDRGRVEGSGEEGGGAGEAADGADAGGYWHWWS